MDKKTEVAKITTTDGRVFYAREVDKPTLLARGDVKRIEDAWMTEEEFAAIPATQEAAEFFSGASQNRARAAS